MRSRPFRSWFIVPQSYHRSVSCHMLMTLQWLNLEVLGLEQPFLKKRSENFFLFGPLTWAFLIRQFLSRITASTCSAPPHRP